MKSGLGWGRKERKPKPCLAVNDDLLLIRVGEKSILQYKLVREKVEKKRGPKKTLREMSDRFNGRFVVGGV